MRLKRMRMYVSDAAIYTGWPEFDDTDDEVGRGRACLALRFLSGLAVRLESSAIIHSRLSVSNEASYKMNVFENVFCIFRATCTKVIPGCRSP